MRQTAILAGVLLLSTSAFAVDSQLLNLVMPDAQIVAGVNVTTARISPLGQYLLTQLATNDQGLLDFISKTGFDPRYDVTEILAASAANPSNPASGLVMGTGNFNVDKLVAAIASSKDQQIQTYAGATLITSTEPKSTHAVAFIGTNVAIGGDVVSVKAALDRANLANSINPALAAQVQTLSATEDVWTVSLASIQAFLPGALAPNATGSGKAALPALQFVKNIQSSSGGVKFGTNIEIMGQAVADTPQNATALADLTRMLAALASMSTGQNPQAAEISSLIQNLKVTTDGATVNITDSILETQVEGLLKLTTTQKPAGAAKLRRL